MHYESGSIFGRLLQILPPQATQNFRLKTDTDSLSLHTSTIVPLKKANFSATIRITLLPKVSLPTLSNEAGKLAKTVTIVPAKNYIRD
jgi:hypothetical protein